MRAGFLLLIQSAHAVAAIEVVQLPGGNRPGAALSFQSTEGQSHLVRTGGDLSNWTPVATISGTGEKIQWTDPASLDEQSRFYQTHPVPTPNGDLSAGSLTVVQSWSQETDYTRDALVSMPGNPANPGGPHPVLITLHGSGGSPNLNAFGYLNDRYIHVAPRGYLNQWNVGRQNTEAPDIEFIRDILIQLRQFDNVDAGNIVIIGSSNGSALLNQLLIELDGSLFQHAIGTVSPMVSEQYHDQQFWGDPEITSNFTTPYTPAMGRRILCMTGTEDGIIPYYGGQGILGYQFLGGQDSTYIFAKAMGEQNAQLADDQGVPVPNLDFPDNPSQIFEYSYLQGDVVHYKVLGVGHNLGGSETNDTRKSLILQFLGIE
jgi:poly(3-hydroxybutyrate) depolymerase